MQYEIHRHCALKTDFNFVWNHSNLDSTGLVAVLLYSPLYKYQPVCVKQSTIKTRPPYHPLTLKENISSDKNKNKKAFIYFEAARYMSHKL